MSEPSNSALNVPEYDELADDERKAAATEPSLGDISELAELVDRHGDPLTLGDISALASESTGDDAFVSSIFAEDDFNLTDEDVPLLTETIALDTALANAVDSMADEPPLLPKEDEVHAGNEPGVADELAALLASDDHGTPTDAVEPRNTPAVATAEAAALMAIDDIAPRETPSALDAAAEAMLAAEPAELSDVAGLDGTLELSSDELAALGVEEDTGKPTMPAGLQQELAQASTAAQELDPADIQAALEIDALLDIDGGAADPAALAPDPFAGLDEPAAGIDAGLSDEAQYDVDGTDIQLPDPAVPAVAGAAAAALAKPESHAPLVEKLDQIIHEAVGDLAKELEARLTQRIEDLLVQSLEAALPRVVAQTLTALREEIRPRIEREVPTIIAAALGKNAGDEK